MIIPSDSNVEGEEEAPLVPAGGGELIFCWVEAQPEMAMLNSNRAEAVKKPNELVFRE